MKESKSRRWGPCFPSPLPGPLTQLPAQKVKWKYSAAELPKSGPENRWAQINMSDSSVFEAQEPMSPSSGQDFSDTTLGSLESIPPWPGPPAEQFAPGPASQQPAVAGRLPPPQRTESTPAAALATAARGGNEGPDRSAPLHAAENPMLQLMIKHTAQIENMQKMTQDMMKNMVSQRTPPALRPSSPQPGRGGRPTAPRTK